MEGEEAVNPVLFVVCQTMADAEYAANVLRRSGMIGEPSAVLEITSQSSDEALVVLSEVEEPGSPIRAVVSVDKLKEGWDVKNIGVIVALRRLASQSRPSRSSAEASGSRRPANRSTDGRPGGYRRPRLLQETSGTEGGPHPTGNSPRAVRGDRGTTGPSRQGEGRPQCSGVRHRARESGTLRLVTPPRVVDGDPVGGTASLIIQEFGVATEQGERDSKCRVLQRVDGAPQVLFPRREQQVIAIQFSLSDITDAEARAAGAGFAKDINAPLVREAINVRRMPGVASTSAVRRSHRRQPSNGCQLTECKRISDSASSNSTWYPKPARS